MKLLIIRTSQSSSQTIGMGALVDNDGQVVFHFSTLELGWWNNFKNLSCIPIGKYKVVKRVSERFNLHFHVKDVPNRNLILIHQGNFIQQTKGCILVGSEHAYIDNNNLLDVKFSRATLQTLLAICPSELDLVIINGF